MSRSIRSLVAAFVSSALLLSQAAPALAVTSMGSDKFDQSAVPVVLDAGALRPLGIMLTGVGFMGFCLISPFMAITRPTDIGKVFSALVIAPARYTWGDPLGEHVAMPTTGN